MYPVVMYVHLFGRLSDCLARQNLSHEVVHNFFLSISLIPEMDISTTDHVKTCLLSCLMQRRLIRPPLGRIFPAEGIFSLGVNMGSDSIPPKLFQMRIYLNQGLVSAHMPSIAQTHKILTFMS